MELKINITKTRFFVLLGAVLFLGVGFFVYAQIVPPNPSVFGHNTNEIDWSQSVTNLLTIEEDTAAGPGYASLDLFSRGTGTRRYSLRSTDGSLGQPLSSFGVYDNTRSIYSLVIDQDGKVGIGGVIDPQDVLDVNGDVRISGIICMSGGAGSPIKCLNNLKGVVVGGYRKDIQGSCDGGVWGQATTGCVCPSGTSEHLTGDSGDKYYVCAFD
jgi:hypothetical protein